MDLNYLQSPPSQNYSPVIDGNQIELPLKEMTWENFEKLCLTLVQEHSGFDISDCDIYGRKGQKQEGIGIYARREINKYHAFQCKRYQTLSASNLVSILREFEQGNWYSKCEKFVLCITVDFTDVILQDKFEELKDYYRIQGKTIEKWDFSALNRILKSLPEVVYDFFGAEWCKKFCGEELYENTIVEFDYIEYQSKLKKASSFLHAIKNHFEKKPLSHIERKETGQIFEWINSDLVFPKRNLLVVEGEKGIGKSVVLKDLYEKILESGNDVLAIKADKYYASNPKELENKLFFDDELTFSKIIKFIKRKKKKLVVIIDQLDALSLTLSSNREFIQTYNRLINELLDEKNIRIIISSRSFDLNYDADLSIYKSDNFRNISISKLDDNDVLNTFKLFNVSCNSSKVIDLLKTPNHLEIFCKLPDKSKINIDSLLTVKDLYDNLWSELISDNLKQKEFVYEIAFDMYVNQKITVQNKYENNYKNEISYLKSNQLIIESGNEIQFFHQTFYDYCFSKQFVEKGKVLKDFILENEQSLYVRSVIKMVVEYLREYNDDTYIKTIDEILNSSKFRFHIKSLIVTNIALQDNPNQKEIQLVNKSVLNNKNLEEVFAFSVNSKKWVLYLIDIKYFNKYFNIKKNFGNLVYDNWGKYKLPKISFIEKFNITKEKERLLNLAYRMIGNKINIAPIEVVKYLDEIEGFEEKDNFISRVLINLEDWSEYDLLPYFEKYIKYFEEQKGRDNFWYYQILRKIFINNNNYVLEKLKPIFHNLFEDEFFRNELIHDIESILEELYKSEPEIIFQLIFDVFYQVIEANKYFVKHKSYDSVFYKCTQFNERYTSINYADLKFEEYIINHLKSKLSNRDYFVAFFNKHKNSNSAVILRILIVSLSASYKAYKEEIYEILKIINSKKGFNEIDNSLQLELRKLIGLIFSEYSIEVKLEITKILLSIRHPYEMGFHKYQNAQGEDKVEFTGFGQKQLKFIKQIPISEINSIPELKKRYQELYRRFGNIDSNKASDVSSFGVYGVSSPLLHNEYENMDLAGWKKSMLKFNDSYVADWHSHTGGKREHSSEFKNMVQQNPDKFLQFIDDLFDTEGISIDYIYSGINGLIEAKYDPHKVKELYKKLLKCNLNKEYTLYAVWKSEYLIIEKVLDIEILDFLCDCSLNHSNPDNDSEVANDHLFESLNTVRGAAIQRVISCHEYLEFKETIFETVEKAIYDKRFSVKVSIITKLAFLNHLDLERSFQIFNLLISNNDGLLKYSFWSSQYFNHKFHMQMGDYFEKIIQHEELHKDAYIIIHNWIDKRVDDKVFEKFISSSKTAKLCAIRVAEGNLFNKEENKINDRCILILKRFLKEKDEEFANAYSGLVLRAFKPNHFKEIYSFLKLYSKRDLCKKEPTYFLEFLLKCTKDYPIECLNLLENMDFNRDNEIAYFHDKEPVKLILAIYSKLNMDLNKNRKHIIKSLDIFDSMLTQSHLRVSANTAIELIV